MLPTFSRLIQIPDQSGVSYQASVVETRELAGYRPVPMQPETPSGFVVDAAAYARQGYGPSEPVRIGEPALARGLRVVPVTFQPVRYDPSRETIEVAGRVQVRVTFAGVDLRNAAQGAPRVIPPSFHRMYQNLVVNYGGPREGQVVGLGVYVIICPDNASVVNALQPLIEWRTRQGYEVHFVTTAQTGTSVESIKTWIQNAYNTWQNPPEYITLVGDANGAIAIPCWYEPYSGRNGETDHYYVMLAGSDILADAHIGRISVDSVDRLTLIVNKIVGYESTPYLTETDWYTRACLVGDPQDSGYSCIQIMQWMKERMRQLAYTEIDTIFSEPFSSQMVQKLNRGDTIFGYRGIMGMSGFSSGHIASLTNGRKMPFAVNLTCDTGSFASGTARSESWIRAGVPPSTPTGGIASIGTATTGTHTRYNNCMHGGIWRAPLWEGLYHFGQCLTRGKYELYINYAVMEMNAAQRFTCWNNLMGDAAGELWTDVPRPMSVTHPAVIALGADAVIVSVTAEGAPCADAYVCLWKGTETFVGGYTDASGRVDLPVRTTTMGNMKVTVTKHDHQPYLGTLSVAPADRFVGYLSHTIDDDNNGASSGNGDHVVNPNERIELAVQVRNFGVQGAAGVTGRLSSDDPRVTVLVDTQPFGDIGGGGSAWSAGSFVILVNGGTPNGRTLYLNLDLSAGAEQWHSLIPLPVVAARFVYDALTLYGFGAQILPGQSGEISVRIKNTGDTPGTSVTGTLASESPWVTLTDASGTFGTIQVGATGENTVDRFGISVSPNCYPGHIASMRVALQFSGGARDTVHFALSVGQAESHDPTGPDLYGYYAFDDTDTGYPQAPIYQWVEIASNHSGPGTSVGLTDNGDAQDDSRTVDLPFPFQYYGETFTRATICSNGWIAMGSTYLTEYRNWNIPCADAPAYMIAAMWDDLYQHDQDKVYQWYDASNHRYIVQWSRIRNNGAYYNNQENFEAILYDPAYYPTDTGDGIIEFQYETFRNIDYEQHYCTVGIQNGDRTDGLMYGYFNYYNAGAAQIGSGRAIRFVPVRAENPAGTGGSDLLPLKLALCPSRPNPFGGALGVTTLRLDLPQASVVRLGIYDVGGRLVRVLVDGRLEPGTHNVTWNGRDDADRPASAGVYFSVLEASGTRIARPVTLMR